MVSISRYVSLVSYTFLFSLLVGCGSGGTGNSSGNSYDPYITIETVKLPDHCTRESGCMLRIGGEVFNEYSDPDVPFTTGEGSSYTFSCGGQFGSTSPGNWDPGVRIDWTNNANGASGSVDALPGYSPYQGGYCFAVWEAEIELIPGINEIEFIAFGIYPRKAEVNYQAVISETAWTKPERMSSFGGGNLDLAIAPDGSAVSVWQRGSPYQGEIWVNRYDPVSGWGEYGSNSNITAIWQNGFFNYETNPLGSNGLVRVDDGSGIAATPKVAMDIAGNALLVWTQEDGDHSQIWANRYNQGAGWSDSEKIPTGDGIAENPQVDFDDFGNATVVWTRTHDTTTTIESIRHTAGDGWESIESVASIDGTISNIQIAVDDIGNAFLVWEHADSIWASYYEAGVGWGQSELIENGSYRATSVQLAIDGSGNALAIWAQSDGTQFDIWVNHYFVNLGWNGAELIETVDSEANSLRIAFDFAGNALATWWQDGLVSKRYIVSQGWDPNPVVVVTNAGIPEQLTMSADGNALVAWRKYWGGDSHIQHYSIYTSYYTPDSGWSKTQVVSSNVIAYGHRPVLPRIEFEPDGHAQAVWPHDAGIWASRFEL